jgi:hypothetical protein
MLQNLDPSDVKVYCFYVVYAGIWFKLAFDATNAETPTQIYSFIAWVATTLTTLALSAWVTLAVIQVALRTEHFNTYGREGCNDIRTKIYYFALNTAKRIPPDPANPLESFKKLFNCGDGLVPQTLEGIKSLVQDLKTIFDATNPANPNHRELSNEELEFIRSTCKYAADWWSSTKPVIISINNHVCHAETYSQIRRYVGNMDVIVKSIEGIEEGNSTNFNALNCIIAMNSFNAQLYRTLLNENGVI